MIISGEAKFTDGTLAENIRIIRISGDHDQDLTPDGTGAYTATVPDVGPYYVIITAQDQRALAHGPIIAIEP
jgi:hypothetical protein